MPRDYVKPSIQTFTARELVAIVGAANAGHGYGDLLKVKKPKTHGHR